MRKRVSSRSEYYSNRPTVPDPPRRPVPNGTQPATRLDVTLWNSLIADAKRLLRDSELTIEPLAGPEAALLSDICCSRYPIMCTERLASSLMLSDDTTADQLALRSEVDTLADAVEPLIWAVLESELEKHSAISTGNRPEDRDSLTHARLTASYAKLRATQRENEQARDNSVRRKKDL